MTQRWKMAMRAATIAAALAATSAAQAQRQVTFVTSTYDLRVQQFSTGSLSSGTRYASFGGEAKAIDNKLAADLKVFAFTIFYRYDASGQVTITDGTFLVQTTNKDRSPITIGGDILPGSLLNLRGAAIAPGQRLMLPLVGSDGSEISGLITAWTDRSAQPKLVGTLSLTYPVVSM